MNLSQARSMRHRQKRSNRRRLEKVASTISLPDDLIKEVLPFLPVKSLTRLRCVAKSFNSFISDPHFIETHFNQSSQRNTNLTLVCSTKCFWVRVKSEYSYFQDVRMLENPPIITDCPYFGEPYELDDWNRDRRYLIDSCNGLLCYFYHSYSDNDSWFRFWNPATRILSDKLGFCHDNLGYPFYFTFGYDHSKHIFKVVRFFPKTTKVKVFRSNDNVWRNIQNSPVTLHHRPNKMTFVHFSHSINWLVICNYSVDDYYDTNYDNYDDHSYKYKYISSIEQFVIISLDLRSEKHTKLLPPQGFNEVPIFMPNLSVLSDCLCFSHDLKGTHFIIWQMREFGVENSWTQFLKISYHDLQIYSIQSHYILIPLCLSEKNDTLLLASNRGKRAILYNWRDNRARLIDQPTWFIYAKDYVESLYF